MAWVTPKTDWLPTDNYNYSDLNKLEGNIQEIFNILTSLGFSVPNYTLNTTRTNVDIEYISSVNRIEEILLETQKKFISSKITFQELNNQSLTFSQLNNLTLTFKVFNFVFKNWYVGTSFSYLDTNRWELLLSNLYKYTSLISESYRRCGTFYIGEDWGIL